MVLKRLPLLLVIACASPPKVPPSTGEVIALAVALDGTYPKAAETRANLADSIADRLHCQAHRVQTISTRQLDGKRSLPSRIEQLRRQAANAPWVALVELHPRFQNRSAGRFRWDVAVRLAVAGRRIGSPTVSDSFSLPALLTRANQGASDALDAVSDEISERLDRLVQRVVDAQAKPHAPQPRLVYLAMVDRFADGDATNNGTVDRQDTQAWHGGDLLGIIKNIDHLQALGVTDLWLTPIFASRQEKFDGHGAFHGYWTHDLRQIEPRFGDLNVARQLRQATRQAGMKLHLDLVTNHVAWNAPLRRAHPDWFHPDTAIDNPEDERQREIGWVHGLPDLAQEKKAVRDYLTDAATHWADTLEPDGFRLDALTHVPADFIRDLRQALDPKIEFLGEIYDGRAHVLADRMRQSGLRQAFDFPLHFALLETFCGKAPIQAFASVLALDRLYDDATELLTFLDNHDRPRLASHCDGDQRRIHQALGMLFAIRGTPVITYGTESGLTGASEPANRGDMRFDAKHPTFAVLQKSLDWRRQYPLLARGQTEVLHAEDGLLVLLRYNGTDRLMISANTRDKQTRWQPKLPMGLALKTKSHMREIAAYGLTIESLQTKDSAAFNAWLTQRQAARSIAFVAPSHAGSGQVVLVGSAPELGSWNPQQAPKLRREGNRMITEVALPASGMIGVKLARIDGQTVHWSQAENHYILPQAVSTPVELRW